MKRRISSHRTKMESSSHDDNGCDSDKNNIDDSQSFSWSTFRKNHVDYKRNKNKNNIQIDNMNDDITTLLPPPRLDPVTARMISACVGSIITSLAVTPLDVAKVRLQSNAHPPSQHNHPVMKNSNVGRGGQARLVPCPHGCGGTMVVEVPRHANSAASAVAETCAVRGRRNLSYVTSCATVLGKIKQVSSSPPAAATTATTVAGSEAPTSTVGMLRHIWWNEGVPGLYRGIRPTLLMAVPNTMLYYTVYDELVQYIRQYCNTSSSLSYAPLLAGGTARWLASTATAPLEFWRTRQAAAAGSSSSSLRQIIQAEGVATLYRGLAPTLWRDVPFSALYWLVIEQLRYQWQQHYHSSSSSLDSSSSVMEQFGQSFVNGFIAGTIAACFTTPFDVVKTRQQASATTTAKLTSSSSCHHSQSAALSSPWSSSSSSTWRALHQVARTEGVAGLWRGNWARTAKVAPSCAIMISTFEVGKLILMAD